MAKNDEEVDFKTCLDRLKEIANKVEDEKIDLDKSLEFLEEGVRLANLCTEKLSENSLGEDEKELKAADS